MANSPVALPAVCMLKEIIIANLARHSDPPYNSTTKAIMLYTISVHSEIESHVDKFERQYNNN